MSYSWTNLRRDEFRRERTRQTLALVFVALMFSGVFAAIFSSLAAADSWQDTSTDNFTGGTRRHTDISGDEVKLSTFENRKAMVVYYDANAATVPKYKTYEDNVHQWSAQGSTPTIVALVFISVPIFVWTVLSPLRPEFVWSDVVNIGIWAFAFVSLAVGERMLHLSLGPPIRVGKLERQLLRSDIRTLRARLDLTNSYLMSAAMIAGMKPLEMYLSQCAKENPTMLDGYELETPGKLRAEPLVENLDRIPPREREQAIFKAFCCIDAPVVILYARLTSVEHATAMVNRSFEEGIRLHGTLLYDYALPALLSGNVLEPLLMKCKKGTREALMKKIRAIGKDHPPIGTLEIEHDGRVNITKFYQALVPMSRGERIRCTMSAFSATLRSSYPTIQSDLGETRTKEMVAGALSDLLKKHLVRWADIRELSGELGLKLGKPRSV